jgi:hypothetical protein
MLSQMLAGEEWSQPRELGAREVSPQNEVAARLGSRDVDDRASPRRAAADPGQALLAPRRRQSGIIFYA